MSFQERSCGGCTACCLTHSVALDSGKPLTRTGEWCVSCNVGVGCKSYQARPSSCQSYTCLWKQGGLKEEQRPDVWGVVVDVCEVPGQSMKLLCFWEYAVGALETPQVVRLMNGMAHTGRYLVVTRYLDGREETLVPENVPEKQIVDFIEALTKHWDALSAERVVV